MTQEHHDDIAFESQVYRVNGGSYRVQYDPARDSEISTLICSVVADISEVDPMELEPLHRTVDPDSLNSLFKFNKPGYSGDEGHVKFSFAEYNVTVHADGTVEIVPMDG